MEILVINPNTSEEMTAAIALECQKMAQPSTTITTISPPTGPRSIESYTEDYVASVSMMEAALERRGQFDALVVACFDDPGLHALRELLDVPVIGIAEASMHMACLVAEQFSVVTVLGRAKRRIEQTVRRSGMTERCASVRTVELSVLQIEEDFDRAQDMIAAEAQRALDEDGAEAICLGCAGLGPLDKKLQAELGVPVLDGCSCAITLAQACFDYGITTSKYLSYLKPAPKEYVGWPAFQAI